MTIVLLSALIVLGINLVFTGYKYLLLEQKFPPTWVFGARFYIGAVIALAIVRSI